MSTVRNNNINRGRNTTRTPENLSLRKNKRTGRFTIPYSKLSQIDIATPPGFKDSGLSLVLYQASIDQTSRVGLMKGEPGNLRAAEDITKLGYAGRALKVALEQQELEKKQIDPYDYLVTQTDSNIRQNLSKNLGRNLKKFIQWNERLLTHHEKIMANYFEGEYNNHFKTYLDKLCQITSLYLNRHMMELCSVENMKVPTIVGVPRHLLVLLIEGSISVPEHETLETIFYSKKKAGFPLILREILEPQTLRVMGLPLNRNIGIIHTFLESNLGRLTEDEKDSLLDAKVSYIPPSAKSMLESDLPTHMNMRSPIWLLNAILKLNQRMRFSSGDNYKDQMVFSEMFDVPLATEEPISARSVLLKKIESGDIEITQDMCDTYYESVIVTIITYYIPDLNRMVKNPHYNEDEENGELEMITQGERYSLGLDYENGRLQEFEDDGNWIPRRLVSYSEPSIVRKTELKQNELLVRILKRKEKSNRGAASGYVMTKKAQSFLKALKKSPTFGGLEEHLSEFLYSFSSDLLQERAAFVLHAELTKYKRQLHEDEDATYDPDEESNTSEDDALFEGM